MFFIEYTSDSYQEKLPDINALCLVACRISARAATLGLIEALLKKLCCVFKCVLKPKRCLHLAAYRSLPLSGCFLHLTSQDS